MKRILIPFLFAALTASAERENLWPEGKMPDAQPHQVAKMTTGFPRPRSRTAAA